jgi:hypothetical protein
MAGLDEANYRGGGEVGININGTPGSFFNTHRGLRQGDPLSPLLFNLVSDALATMLEKAKETNQIRGVIPHLVEGGLTHLQYADDTIIFLSLEEQTILNTKFLLYCFEDMSGLKINYQKSEVFVVGGQMKLITELQASSTVKWGLFL